MMGPVRIGVLGPVGVYDADGAAVPLRRAKTRALLAALAMHLHRAVSRDALLDALWGDTPPEGAETTLQSYVSQLRRVLALSDVKEGPVVRSRAGSYVLEADPEVVDACRFERLAAEGAAALGAGDIAGADRVLSRALSLWRGRAYAEFADEPFARAESERLEEARLAALEDHFDAALALGRHGRVVADLEAATTAHSLRERFCAQLMLALYRSGRQADALDRYRRLRVRLAEELGIDPSPEVRDLERAILQQRPELAWSGPDLPLRPAGAEGRATVGRGSDLSAAGGPTTPVPLVTTAPETRFAKSGDVHIAYQVVGDGPLDLVFVPGVLNHLELLWEEGTEAQRFFTRLASFSRLILFDKRGTGLSDRDVGAPTLEERMDDLRAVMDAAGSERAAIIGYSEGGPMSVLFATAYPERVSALVLAATTARFYPTPGYPCGEGTGQLIDRFRRIISESWGQGNSVELFLPSLAHSKSARANIARWERLAASPGGMSAYLTLAPGIDVRDLLPAVRLPTLVIYRSDDIICDACHARYLAEHIPGARLVEHSGGSHILWADAGPLADDIEAFLTGNKSDPDVDRVLTTVLFTDIVGSTERAETLGDRRWRQLLDRHDHVARRAIERYRGRLVKTTGDGLLATFDGPARAVRCATTIQDEVKALGLDIRAGVHTGEVERRGEDLGGIAVHIGQRIASLADPGQVLVSSTVHDLVFGSGIQFQAKGARALRGVPGRWRLFTVSAAPEN